MFNIKYYNTKVIDYGNGNKQVITYAYPIAIEDNEELKELKRLYKKDLKENTDTTTLSSVELEKKELHSIFSSANRTKNELYKIARSNTWDWFITLTFNRDKVSDRTDYVSLQKKVSKFFDNIKQRKCPDLKYVLVPEQHKKIEKNGQRAWHFHGLLANCSELTFEKLDIAYAKKTNESVYSIKEFKLGYNTATKVKNNEAVTRYIAKYITKSLCYSTKNRQRYLVSKSCNRPKEYTYMCMNDYNDNSDFKQLSDIVHLCDIIDNTKIVWKKEKIISNEEFCNVYTYYELKNDYSPIISIDKAVTIKE